MAEIPVAFMFFISEFDASQAMSFCHDEHFDILDIHRFGHSLVGFFEYEEFRRCEIFCSMLNFDFVVFCIRQMPS